jgi:hypothetical protein
LETKIHDNDFTLLQINIFDYLLKKIITFVDTDTSYIAHFKLTIVRLSLHPISLEYAIAI